MNDDANDLRTMGANIRRLRKARGWSLQYLAGEIGEGYSLLAKYERGEVQPGVLTAKKIAKALGESLDAILDESEMLQGVA